jgi:hypothetical protein
MQGAEGRAPGPAGARDARVTGGTPARTSGTPARTSGTLLPRTGGTLPRTAAVAGGPCRSICACLAPGRTGYPAGVTPEADGTGASTDTGP